MRFFKIGIILPIVLFFVQITLGQSNIQEMSACRGDLVTLAGDFMANSYLWSTGEKTRIINFATDNKNSDTVWVKQVSNSGTTIDTFVIYVVALPVVKFSTFPLICNDSAFVDLDGFGIVPSGGKGVWSLPQKQAAIINNILYPQKLTAGNYTLKYTCYNKYNCKNSDTTTLFIKQCTSSIARNIEELTKIDIFPNPVYDFLNITFPNPVNKETSFAIQNIVGEKLVIFSIPIGMDYYKLDISQLPKGVYILTGGNGNSIANKKIIKQ